MKTLADIIGENIRRKRMERGMTQVNLAKMIDGRNQSNVSNGRNQSNVSIWERGIFCPDAYALRELSRVFCCTIEELMEETL